MSEETREIRKNTEAGKIKKEALKEILRGKIDKIEFKEIRDSILGVLYIVCEFSIGGILLARGISIRSLLDGFNRKKGKNKAFGRAVKALLSETSTEPIREYIDDNIISRSLTRRNKEDSEEFLKIVPFLESSAYRNGKYGYRVNAFLPLKLVSGSVKFKSEFIPAPVEFRGVI